MDFYNKYDNNNNKNLTSHGDIYKKVIIIACLEEGYSDKDYEEFLNKIDHEYSNSYGIQHLFGYIWYSDGTWSERYEYDGSEMWDYKKRLSYQDAYNIYIE